MLETGKLDSEILKRIIFGNITYRREEILTRPGIGEDCAEVDFGEKICVMSTDPITASVKDIGRLAIHISCNDIASNGVQPVGIMLCVLLPVGTTEEDVESIMKQAARAAERMEVEIIGGHTEITAAVNQPVICSTAVGIDQKSRKKEKIKAGDLIFMTKSCGLEGTGIIASEREEISRYLNDDEICEARGYLDRVSVVQEGVAAGKIGVSAMHDITEGGVLGAVWEMASVGKVGACLNVSAVPVTEVTRKLSEALGLNHLRLISSGCMLIIADPEKKAALMKDIEEITQIGEIKEEEYGIRMVMDGVETVIDPPAADEIYKVIK